MSSTYALPPRRSFLRRLRDCIGAVPAPAGQGTQSASIRAVAGYSADAVTLNRHVRAALTEEVNRNSMWVDPPTSDDYLSWLEAWVALRTSQDWSFDGARYYDLLDDRVSVKEPA